jgi:cation diffusion facilitator CzcD-associated flavoprotein CzcO
VPHTPEELLSFKGPRMHSAKWDPTISLEGKTVGIVGSGASAVQIIPSIVDKVKKMFVYQRFRLLH